MKIIENFRNLKVAAKRVFVGLLVLSLVCTCTGIGSIFAYADNPEGSPALTEGAGNTEGVNTEGGNTEGGNTEGGNTEGGNTEGGNTEGGNTEGGNTEGGNTEGGNTEGGNTEGGNTEGGNTEGGNTEGGNTEGGNTEGGNTEGGNTEGGNTEGGNAAGGNSEGGTQTAGAGNGESAAGAGSGSIGTTEGGSGTASGTGAGEEGSAGASGASGNSGAGEISGASGSSDESGNSAAGGEAGSATSASSGASDDAATSSSSTYDHEHIFVYTSNGDGTHTITCSVSGCDYTVVEDCSLNDEDVCTLCEGSRPTLLRTLRTMLLGAPAPLAAPNLEFAAFWSTQPSVASGLSFIPGQDQNLLAEAGTLVEPFDFTNEESGQQYSISDISVAYKLDGTETALSDIKKQNAGTYTVQAVVSYKYKAKDADDDTKVAATKDGDSLSVTISPRNLADGCIFDKGNTVNLTDLASTELSNPHALTYSVGEVHSALVSGTDYTLDVDLTQPQKATSTVTAKYTGTGNYTGMLTAEITVGDVTVLFDGSSELASSYVSYLTFSSETGDYQISLDKTTYGQTAKYDAVGKNQKVKVYLKKTASGIVIEKEISGITITNGELIVLYDGVPEKKSFYYETVRISAEGYEVSTASDGSGSSSSLVLNRTEFAPGAAKSALDVSKQLFFKNLKTNEIISRTITGLNLLAEKSNIILDTDILYNGEALREWYPEAVVITCNNYLISDVKETAGSYTESYTLDGNGAVSKMLYFRKSTESTDDAQSLAVLVHIDKTAPTGSITAGGFTSEAFVVSDSKAMCDNTPDTVTFAADDDLSGLSSISYYISEEFYSTANAVDTAAAGKWIRYSAGDNVKLSENKINHVYMMMIDNVGNTSYISTPQLICDTVAPAIKEINASKITNGAQIRVDGTDELSGIKEFYVLAKEKTDSVSEPSQSEFTSSGVKITASKEADGSYKGVGNIENLDNSKTFVFYVMAVDEAGNYSQVKSKIGYAQEISIKILYNGADLKDWYNTDVKLTCEGYEISDANKNTFLSEYTISGSGTITKTLDFRSTSTGTIKTYDITVKIDRAAPTGSISSGDYTSKDFKNGDTFAYYTGKLRQTSVLATDELSGIAEIGYYVSEKVITSPTDLENTIKNEKTAYKTYTAGSTISFTENKANYLYVRITDNAGNATYLSTGKILYDTKAPTMSNLTIAKPTSGTGTVVAFVGTDEMSGINRFKLMYFDKADGKSAPNKDYMFDQGIYIEVKTEEGETAGATYTIGDLDESKTYVFYAVAVDRAGNISDVKSSEGTSGSSASAGAGAGAGAGSSGTKTSGLTPAPNGIAGSGTAGGAAGGGAGSGSGTGNSSATTGSSSYPDPLAKEIVRLPYIADATGATKIGLEATGGWDRIIAEIKKADMDATIEIEMSGMSDIPLSVFTAMAGRPVTVRFLMPQNVSWVVKGTDIPADGSYEINLGVRVGSKRIPQQTLDDVTDTNPHFEFELDYDGPFGFPVCLEFPVGTQYSGLYANLYHYKEDTKDMVLEGTSVIGPDGYASFTMSHASAYTIVITSMALLTEKAPIIVTDEQNLVDNESYVSTDVSLRIPDLFGLRGQVRLYLIIIGIVSAALCVAILFMPGLQLPKKKEESLF